MDKDQEIIELHRQLAHERLRADLGWERYEAANTDRNSVRAMMVAKVQAIALPTPWLNDLSATPGSQKHYAEDQMVDMANTAILWKNIAMDAIKTLESMTSFCDRVINDKLGNRNGK